MKKEKKEEDYHIEWTYLACLRMMVAYSPSIA